MTRSFRKRGWIALLVLVSSALLAVYVVSRPHLAPGQKPLTDIRSIETLRTQSSTGRPMLCLLLIWRQALSIKAEGNSGSRRIRDKEEIPIQ